MYNEKRLTENIKAKMHAMLEADVIAPITTETVELGQMVYHLLDGKWQTAKDGNDFYQFPWGQKVFKKDFE